jgi:hypothetical protein
MMKKLFGDGVAQRLSPVEEKKERDWIWEK